jgi:rhodanese-related sulfurtransferase
MNNAPLISPMVFDRLRELAIEPYTHLSDIARENIGHGVRLLSMVPGETFITQKPGLRINVLSGGIRLEPGGRELDLDNTRHHAVLTQRGENCLRADVSAVVLLADADFLDSLCSWSELASHAQQSGNETLWKRLLVVQHTLAFRRLPLEHVIQVLEQMVPQKVKAGEVIITQGESADTFHLIWSGKAEVWQKGLYDDKQQLVSTLGPGDTFGDEALVTRGTRNATVRMSEDGELLVLGGEAFRELMLHPLIEEVPPSSVQAMLDDGWKALDVRYEEEFEEGHIPGAILLPLPDLRRRADDVLDKGVRYITVCRSGKRSAVAAFLLEQRGYKAISMKAGMNAWQGATVC